MPTAIREHAIDDALPELVEMLQKRHLPCRELVLSIGLGRDAGAPPAWRAGEGNEGHKREPA